LLFFFFQPSYPTTISPLSLHDALPICTFCTTTGMVMRKMISSTSITSTSGVVLICEFRSSSSACPTCIAMSDHLVRSMAAAEQRSEEHTSELQSRGHLVCRLLLEKKKK